MVITKIIHIGFLLNFRDTFKYHFRSFIRPLGVVLSGAEVGKGHKGQ